MCRRGWNSGLGAQARVLPSSSVEAERGEDVQGIGGTEPGAP